MSNRPHVTRIFRFLRCASGVAAIEFAIVLPLLIILVFGTFSIGWVMHSVSSVDYALEQTSRVLQLNPKMTQSSLQANLEKNIAYYGEFPVTLGMTVGKDPYGANVAHLTATYAYEIKVPLVTTYAGTIVRRTDVFLGIPN